MKNVCTRKKKNQQEKRPNQLKENLKDFIISGRRIVNATEKERLEEQTNIQHNVFERVDNSLSESQVKKSNTEYRIRNAVDNAVNAVENYMHDAILSAKNFVVIQRNDMAVRLFKGSSRNGTKGTVQSGNLNQEIPKGNAENTPLRSASSRPDSKIEQDEIDETRDVGNSEDDNFLGTKPN